MVSEGEEEGQEVPERQEDIPDPEGSDAEVEDIRAREAGSIKKEIRLALVEGSDSRVDHNIHVSNLIEFCPREFALCDQRGFNFNPGKKIYPGLALTFKIGHAIHRIIQDALKHSGMMVLDEVNLALPVGKFMITGTNDGLIKLVGKKRLRIVEIKSISAEEYKDLMEAKINHECQLSLYLWKAKKLSIHAIHPDYGFIIYVCKGHRVDPIKIFPVARNDRFLEGVEKKVESLKTFSETGELPARVCTTRHAMMAKRCSCKTWCFETLSEGDIILKEEA